MRTALKPAALTPSIVACVHLGFPQTVSFATPPLTASIWLPMFQPGAIASNTICGVMAVAVADGMTRASSVTATVALSLPQVMVTVPLPAAVVRRGPTEIFTGVWWSLSIQPVSRPIHAASAFTVGWLAEVTVNVTSPPLRSKETEVLSTASAMTGWVCRTEISTLCLSDWTRTVAERSRRPL